MKKPQILILVAYYLPGYKAGGPMRTLANMVDRLGDVFRFRIVTSDRDLQDRMPYIKIKVDEWTKVGKAHVYYMSPKKHRLKEFKKILCSTEYDIVYLNSFFSLHFAIKPLLLRKLRMVPDKSLVIASRGVFSPGAFGLKRSKKRIYLLAAKVLGLYRGALWQASSEYEEADIRYWFGNNARVFIAPNLPPLVHQPGNLPPKNEKIKGLLNILFLSRVSRKKNLDGALKILNGLGGKICFDIYGPLEDKVYWEECQKCISRLSGNTEVRYCGTLEHEKVSSVMREYDLLFLPTLGENFGNVILEAFCAGCPVLISDQTPWRNLEEKNIGWDLPLGRPELFRAVLKKCIDMEKEEYQIWSEKAMNYGLKTLKNSEVVLQNRGLFYDALYS